MSVRVAAIVPAYRVKRHIKQVVESLLPLVEFVVVVDDACPEDSGKFLQSEMNHNPRVHLIYHETNLGVGGAVKSGYDLAVSLGAEILVKVDGDGQMRLEFLHLLVGPIERGQADYTKGNRFYHPKALAGMPVARIVGNGALSILSKLSTGYWKLLDPTNGFTAIHSKVWGLITQREIAQRYFFETDLLFRLHLVRAVVSDVPIPAKYGDEKSNLKLSHAFFSFGIQHLTRFFKRIVYDYFILEFNPASIQILVGLPLMIFGFVLGAQTWLHGKAYNVAAEPGLVALSILPFIMGFQLLLAALQYDISFSAPSESLHKKLV
jgi:dolichol-phosphate mannosyltransferase